MLNIVEWGDEEEASYLDIAIEISKQLEKAYPNHPWEVSFQGGALIVRHKTINAEVAAFLKREGFGMVLPKDKLGSYREIVKSAIEAGGAMLELFKLPRGAWDGSDPAIPSDWKRKQETDFA
jgi:hypothetical protein